MFFFSLLYAYLVPRNVLGSGGAETPLNGGSGGWRGGLRHPLKSPLNMLHIVLKYELLFQYLAAFTFLH